jgi:alanyl-tRNA synthetase
MEEARAEGAMALFEENYGDKVRLVNVGEISKELCGGTHVVRSGDIGSIHITAESGVAAGVRRLEAVCGSAALSFVNEKRKIIKTACDQLKSSEGDLVVKLENVLNKEKVLLKEIENLKRNLAGKSKDLESEAREIKGVKVIGAKLQVGDPGTLRESADNLKMKIKSGVICLGGDNGGKAAIVVSVTDDLTDRLHAGKLIKEVSALIGGKGGGRADMAQAGGNDLSKLDEALKSIYNLVETTLT